MTASPDSERPAFQVVLYSDAAFETLLRGEPIAGLDYHLPPGRPTAGHLAFFKSRFSPNALDVRTLVVEPSYVDGDYLEDYSVHYSRCFRDYPRTCMRIHFFAKEISEREFADFLTSDPQSDEPRFLEIRNAYLGFLVRRPLPQTVIGRTCLRPPEGQGRSFPSVRRYDANLFGQPLSVESVAFQEQDKTVSACATSALWSAFHITGKRFQHPIPSPSEITRTANELHPLESRGIPSGGLNIQQMAACVRSVGLEPFAIDVAKPLTGDTENLVERQRESVLRGSIYAYAKLGLPVLLGFNLDGPKVRDGRHVTTVVGYSLNEAAPAAAADQKLPLGRRLEAFRLQELYVHDDQVGPFATMNFNAGAADENGRFSLSTDWGGGGYRAIPAQLLVPLYHKIRIPYNQVFKTVHEIDRILPPVGGQFVTWDLFLTSACEFRASIRKMGLSSEATVELLARPCPRFLWRATACWREHPVFDLLFDATDLAQSDGLVEVIAYSQEAGKPPHFVSTLGKLFSMASVVRPTDFAALAVFSRFVESRWVAA